MIRLRPANERGHSNLGWLDSRHSFSFGDYHDPAHVGFRTLRVINDDRIAPGMGFGTHPHHDMEILTWVVEGAIEHRDSMGNGSILKPGEMQRMTAGTGVTHSEFNPSQTEPLRLIQIWIRPETRGLTPSYEERSFPVDERRGELVLLAARDARDGALTIHQDVVLYVARLDADDEVSHALQADRHAWVQVVKGELELGEKTLKEGDGAAISNEAEVGLRARTPSEVLVFDLA
ncbi:MAG TPA: pirin family protein [Planctomycetota bacterium]|nr:pirin family protein [Planctomycetota bacterium]